MYVGSRVYMCEFVGNVIKEEGNLCEGDNTRGQEGVAI